MTWLDRFRRQPPETRASATDVLVQAIQTAAAGISTGNASAIAALEVASGMWSRAFAAATVKPQTLATRAITPAILSSIGRQLVMRGQSLHALMVERGQVRLDPIGYWEIRGNSPNEDDWIVRCEFYGPTGSYSRIISHKNVVNCRYSCLPSQPSRGLSPMDFAAATGKLAGNIEQRLSDEAGGPSGYLIPVPEDPGGENTESDSLSDLKSDLTNLKGKTGLVESSAGGWGDPGSKPRKDFMPSRFGLDPPRATDKPEKRCGRFGPGLQSHTAFPCADQLRWHSTERELSAMGESGLYPYREDGSCRVLKSPGCRDQFRVGSAARGRRHRKVSSCEVTRRDRGSFSRASVTTVWPSGPRRCLETTEHPANGQSGIGPRRWIGIC